MGGAGVVGKILRALFVGGIMVGAASAGFAQGTEEREIAYGTIARITDNTIVLQVYDFTTETDIEVAYGKTPETAYENFNSSQDLHVGDEVDIEYIEAGGEKKILTVYKIIPEEIDIPQDEKID
jgi:hypothetical protein